MADLLCLKTGSSYQNIKNDLWAKFMNTVKRAFFAGSFFRGIWRFRFSRFVIFAVAGLLQDLHTLKGQSSTEKQ